ncbi:MAG: prolyl oligopeptidase family serine peptidase [Acidobacteria bacterium]|nr:prolyl oligopeptidase family serine peptidase [Acidobacteriota bacterium]
MHSRWVCFHSIIFFAALTISPAFRQGSAAQNTEPRRIPPAGINVSAEDRRALQEGINALGSEIEALRQSLKSSPALLRLLPDVEIFYHAPRYALSFNEFFKPEEIELAKAELRQGRERAAALRAGQAPWTSQTGLVVRGYRSEIDGSIQPYGLVVPASWKPDSAHQFRLDVWFHGRHETLSEVNFLGERQKNAGQFTPHNAFVLHPYGRYCNANKFAGEVDLFEALTSVQGNYPIDENRISVRGFSMGGAATWHIAAHHAGLWAAAAPGAGFAETAEYLKLRQDPAKMPPWYEQKLWHLYDATDYAINLFNLPTVAYSGEIDRQKQAAEIMAGALKAEGIELVHIIGPKTEHKYHPDSIREIDRRIDSIVEKGRDQLPRRVRLTTWTLRYNRMRWVAIDRLERHWERARIDAELVDSSTVDVRTMNVRALSLEMAAGQSPFDVMGRPSAIIDGQRIEAPRTRSDRSWQAHFRKDSDRWVSVERIESDGIEKKHGLQGPIDDAFMSSFIFIRPTGPAINDRVRRWIDAEMERALTQWRSQFRGEARVVDDTDVTPEMIDRSNLILWGDPTSNRFLARIIDRLPIGWNSTMVSLGRENFDARRHIPILIYPNPANPDRYVVINSSFTFREQHYLTNAQQTPKLPDWAVVEMSSPDQPHTLGRVATAGFFDEKWRFSKIDSTR